MDDIDDNEADHEDRHNLVEFLEKEELLDKLYEQKRELMKKVKNLKPKIVRRKSKVEAIIEQRAPKILEYLIVIKLLLSIVYYSIAVQFPALAYQFTQFFEKGFVDGEELLNADFLKYFFGAYVWSHVDQPGLIWRLMQFFGVYCVIKMSKKSSDAVLCHCWDGSSKCNHKNCDSFDPLWGGHINISPLTLYMMFGMGAFGGPQHSLHGNLTKGMKNLWQGFQDEEAWTCVLRPMSAED